jgi:hypothetical protein
VAGYTLQDKIRDAAFGNYQIIEFGLTAPAAVG